MTRNGKPVEQGDTEMHSNAKKSEPATPSDRRNPVDSLRNGSAPGGEAVISPTHVRLSPNLPEGLAEDGPGAKLWRRVSSAPLLLSAPEAVMIELAARELDLAEQCAAVVAVEGVTLAWGDSVRAHPLLGKISEHRGLAARLLQSQNVPDDAAQQPRQAASRGRRGVYRVYRTEA